MATELHYQATGRRKNAIARVRLMPGTGQIMINERSFEKYFPRESDRSILQKPLETTSMVGKYNVHANVQGGGSTGQAGAVRHGIARALLSIDPGFREALRKEGLLTRDPRVKERKKYGQRGARRRFQYSKR
ncbi:MAG TPA: 30S ribosomal protein S9 [Nitrospiria bacterium]|nr:30S ribosomal protein S9 [Nitrospiria bacterium]